MGVLERRRIVEARCCLLDRLHDRLAAVASIYAEQTGGAVDHLTAIRREEVHILGAGEEARSLLERAVWRKWQPIGLKLVGFHIERRHRNPPIVSQGVSSHSGGTLVKFADARPSRSRGLIGIAYQALFSQVVGP